MKSGKIYEDDERKEGYINIRDPFQICCDPEDDKQNHLILSL